jgi:hypothetical protein
MVGCSEQETSAFHKMPGIFYHLRGSVYFSGGPLEAVINIHAGRAIAQTVSRRLPNVAARDNSVGIGTGYVR